MKMEGYGVDVEEYKAPTPTRKFRAWVEDWELPLLKNNDVIAEVRLIEKYKGLLFYDPDNKSMYTVYPKNLEWARGRGGGWSLICQPADDDLDNEPFLIGDMVIGLIANTDQEESVEIILNGKVGSDESGALA